MCCNSWESSSSITLYNFIVVRNSLLITHVKYSYLQTYSTSFNAVDIFPLFQILAVFACIASTQSDQFQRFRKQHDYLAVNIKTFHVSANGMLGDSSYGRPCYLAFAEGGSSIKMRFFGRSRWWLVESVHVTFWRHLRKAYTKSAKFFIAGEKNFSCVISLPQWLCYRNFEQLVSHTNVHWSGFGWDDSHDYYNVRPSILA